MLTRLWRRCGRGARLAPPRAALRSWGAFALLLELTGWLGLAAGPAAAQGPAAGPAPPASADPVLRLEGHGPLSHVTAAAFGPDGDTLYETGWDKLVRVWRHQPRAGRFQLVEREGLRIPIGPGDDGVMNALAVSGDGRWLAVGGNAVDPAGAGFRQLGVVVPQAEPNSWAQGVIYVFDLQAEPPRCRTLAGHRGPVKALAFVAEARAGQGPRLLSAGSEPPPQGGGRPALWLRVWDVARRAEIDSAEVGTNAEAVPWLAAWSVPTQPDRIRVAAAWSQWDEARKMSYFAVWDVGAGQPRLVADPYGGRTFALARGAGGDEIVTGHLGYVDRRPEGVLASWDASAAPPAPVRRRTVPWSGPAVANPGPRAVPVALARVGPRPGGMPDLLAVVVRRWLPAPAPAPAPATDAAPPAEYRLQLVDLAPASFGAVKADVALWSGPLVDPVVAASADGRRLAIVGHPASEVHVHDVGRLLAGATEPERLRGVGDPVGVVRFVRRGDDWGVRIGPASAAVAPGEEPPPPGADDLVLDLTHGQLGGALDGWVPSVPAAGAWQSRLVAPRAAAADQPVTPWTLWLYENRVAVSPAVVITPDSRTLGNQHLRVTDYAVRPPRAGAAKADREPMVAVAAYEPGVGPWLRLYNGRSGEEVRQLSGHTGTIRSVAFSADGRFLVSGGDDRTVCVWRLADLDKVVGIQGGLRWLALSVANGRYVVAEIRPNPRQGAVDLLPGDVVEGRVERGQVVPLSSVNDLHFTAAARRPGDVVELRVRRGGGPARDVRLRLGQAIDERKPLFTLFVAQPEEGAQREWLGWNPFGPYDRSGPAIESLFGWHFNAPENAESPARFALATQYPQFRREGLLRGLIGNGPIPEPERLPAPEMGVFLDPEGQVDEARGWHVLERPPTALGVSVSDKVPADRIRSVTWQLGDGPPRPLHLKGGFWSADPSAVAWNELPRGKPLMLSVVVTTDEFWPQRFAAEPRRVVFLPRPRVTVQAPAGLAAATGANPLKVDDRRFRVEAAIEPAPGVPAAATLTRRHGEDLIETRPDGAFDGRRPLVETIELKPGLNRITIEARNADARGGLEAFETTRAGPFVVLFQPAPSAPPAIELEALSPLSPDGKPAGELVRVDGADPVVVDTPRVRLQGRVRTEDALAAVERSEEGRPWTAVSHPPARGATLVELSEPVDLVAGRPTTVRIRARAVNPKGGEAEAIEVLRIEYHPALPTLTDVRMNPPGPVVVSGLGPEPEPLTLTAKLALAGVEREAAVEAAVLIGDEEADPPTLDPRQGTLSARVRLRPGRNEIRIRLANRWRTAIAWRGFAEYRRPPRIEDVAVAPQGGRPNATVTARVASVIPLTGADVEVRGPSRDAPPSWIRLDPRPDAAGLWIMTATVPVEVGTNALVIRTRNDDGPSAEHRLTHVYNKPPPPPPELTLRSAPDGNVQRPQFDLDFDVTTSLPLERVEIVRLRPRAPADVVHAYVGAELARDRRQEGGRIVWSRKATLTLEPRVNEFRVVAINSAGGKVSQDMKLTYVCPAVRVENVEILPRTGSRAVASPPAGAAAFSPRKFTVPEGRALLRGQVVWIDNDPARGSEEPEVEVWVNGFPQVAARFQPGRARGPEFVRDFQGEILLSRPDNFIEVKLLHRPLEIHGDPRLAVACAKPDTRFRLHLIVLSTATTDAQALQRRAVAALKGGAVVDREFVTPAFSEARIYGPVCPRIDRRRLNGIFFEISVKMRSAFQPSNEVVMFYYQGGEAYDKKTGLELRLTKADEPGEFYPLAEIRRTLERFRGAKLFLLDVSHAPEQMPQILADSGLWTREGSPFGLLHFSRPEPPPADASLVVALGEAVRESATLGQVNAKVLERTATLVQRVPGVHYEPKLPATLEALVIGGGQ